METKLDTYSGEGSPYSKRKAHHHHDAMNSSSGPIEQARSLTPDEEKPEPPPEIFINKQEFVEEFNRHSMLMASGKSPYSRRYPMSTKRDNQWVTNSSGSSSDEEMKIKIIEKPQRHDSDIEGTNANAQDELYDAHVSDIALPASIEPEPSTMMLRNRRDPQYSGIRAYKPKRVLQKSGKRNVSFINAPKQFKYFKDIVTTIIEVQWRWTLTIFIMSYFVSWTFFALFYYVIAYAHGDLEFDADGNRLGEGGQECIRGAVGFAGFFLMSVESQVSTGYGERYPTEECPEAIFLLVVQLVIGLVIDGAMIGIVYVKLIRPNRKNQVTKFSKRLVVCQREGKLCLNFRMCDPFSNHYIATKVRVVLIRKKRSGGKDKPDFVQVPLKMDNRGRMILIWPIVMSHVIDETSPFYDMSARDLLAKKFEILVTLTGDNKVTGQTTQARTSYLNNEIMWGHRFVNMVVYDEEAENYVVQNERFDETEMVDTPLCSAKRMDEILDELQENGYGDSETASEHPSNFYLGTEHMSSLRYNWSVKTFDKVDEDKELESAEGLDKRPIFHLGADTTTEKVEKD